MIRRWTVSKQICMKQMTGMNEEITGLGFISSRGKEMVLRRFLLNFSYKISPKELDSWVSNSISTKQE